MNEIIQEQYNHFKLHCEVSLMTYTPGLVWVKLMQILDAILRH